MCSIQEQLTICKKHHIYMHDAMKLMGASRRKFKPVWEQMVIDYENQTGRRSLSSWGLPLDFVLNYLGIDLNHLLKMANTEKNSE